VTRLRRATTDPPRSARPGTRRSAGGSQAWPPSPRLPRRRAGPQGPPAWRRPGGLRPRRPRRRAVWCGPPPPAPTPERRRRRQGPGGPRSAPDCLAGGRRRARPGVPGGGVVGAQGGRGSGWRAHASRAATPGSDSLSSGPWGGTVWDAPLRRARSPAMISARSRPPAGVRGGEEGPAGDELGGRRPHHGVGQRVPGGADQPGGVTHPQRVRPRARHRVGLGGEGEGEPAEQPVVIGPQGADPPGVGAARRDGGQQPAPSQEVRPAVMAADQASTLGRSRRGVVAR
jgi:hypothetical protein